MKFAYQWHRRVGWVLAPLLALSASSGAVLLWLQPLPVDPAGTPPVHAWAQALDLGVAELARQHPGAQVESVTLPREADAPIRVHLRSAAGDSGWADIDASRGTVHALRPQGGDARTRLFELHEHLLLGNVGPWVLRAVALGALVLVAMGLRIWWRVRLLPARSPWRRWHRRIGPVAILPLAMMLATGFVLRSPELARGTLTALSGEAVTPALAAASTGDPVQATPGQALAAAAAAVPEARPTRIYAPQGGVLRVRLRSSEWNPFGLTYVHLSAADASVLRVVRAGEQPLSVRYLDVVYPLHTGWLPGHANRTVALAMRTLWTLFALSLVALAVSGAIQRFKK